MRRAYLPALLVLASACNEDFKPETLVDQLRVLAVQATPAELAPGGGARLTSLVVDPSRPGKKSTVLWIACDPDPLDLNRSACSDYTALSDASGQASVPDLSSLPPGMKLAGFNDQAGYSAPADLFFSLAQDDPRRRLGTVAQVLLFAIAEEVSPGASQAELDALMERVRNQEVRSVLAIFRVRVSEDPQVNQNPQLSGLEVDGQAPPAGGALRFQEASESRLGLDAPDSAFEVFERLTPEGPEQQTERILAAWYSTWGRFSEERVALRSGTEQRFQTPGTDQEKLPEPREGVLWVVARDTRGGEAWSRYDTFLCDRSLPAPRADVVTPTTASAGTRLTLSGENLASVLDVQVGPAVLGDMTYSPGRGELEGALPQLPAGDYPLVLRGKHCDDVGSALWVHVSP